jgi:nitroreductase
MGISARCRDVCRPPTLAKNTVERQAASEYRVRQTGCASQMLLIVCRRIVGIAPFYRGG